MSKIERILSLGCIVCRNEYKIFSPAEFHHAHGPDKTRIGPEVGLPLCWRHHRSGIRGESRHPYKAAWEKRFGKETDLYQQVLKLLEADE